MIKNENKFCNISIVSQTGTGSVPSKLHLCSLFTHKIFIVLEYILLYGTDMHLLELDKLYKVVFLRALHQWQAVVPLKVQFLHIFPDCIMIGQQRCDVIHYVFIKQKMDGKIILLVAYFRRLVILYIMQENLNWQQSTLWWITQFLPLISYAPGPLEEVRTIHLGFSISLLPWLQPSTLICLTTQGFWYLKLVVASTLFVWKQYVYPLMTMYLIVFLENLCFTS